MARRWAPDRHHRSDHGDARRGDFFFGHSDTNATSSADANDTALLFTLIDNVKVTEFITIDVDGNGTAGPLTDALLVLRYLFRYPDRSGFSHGCNVITPNVVREACMQRSRVLAFVIVALVLGAAAVAANTRHDQGSRGGSLIADAASGAPKTILSFIAMYGVDGPFLDEDNAINGLPGDELS